MKQLKDMILKDLKGVPYDGKLTKADGKGKWWEGYDPQDLYAQNHPLSQNSWDNGAIHRQWAWEMEFVYQHRNIALISIIVHLM